MAIIEAKEYKSFVPIPNTEVKLILVKRSKNARVFHVTVREIGLGE